ncbi:methylmalonyl Co-A mutase-associated GTPase MeaB [Fictibacillus sp. 5RED26]|uniref:methylmalonyl Co-A mutase-associated GTPase MeaB n=1 Tax=unclassified Fictibacillus TaxID=2644029 RepID=UPI0018CF4FBE|nr:MULTISPECIES: methylmalonyl Co-A mutase-associated GTPase MeaB [unclassified Fictibacillus]MBH0156377.1 methylmalonyl Co-A mutase-associated GTPase MeaB [Fictibacillus sp. 5RED26]MBH0175296.1 methylmalonyl Co-A mutase-associated GTPase MeaB [Fictibacillus sp. 23RED33]
MHPLAQRIQQREERALAKAITLAENNGEDKLELLKSIYPQQKGAHWIGITGSPGAGKSSLVNRLISFLRQKQMTVAVVAVDPTSPFSGGSILGDRVRMADHFTDPGVFIRSMGTRGSLGGLSRSTKETVRLMDAYGFDVILIETVGVGQSELDIMKLADSVAVVLNPGSGDVVQVFKAGIMEIADLFVVNKADMPGVPKLLAEIEAMLDLVKHDSPYRPPVVQTVSTENKGLQELWDSLLAHREYLEKSGEGKERKLSNLKREVMEVVQHEIYQQVLKQEQKNGFSWLADLESGTTDPYTAAEKILIKRLQPADGKQK